MLFSIITRIREHRSTFSHASGLTESQMYSCNQSMFCLFLTQGLKALKTSSLSLVLCELTLRNYLLRKLVQNSLMQLRHVMNSGLHITSLEKKHYS